MEVRDGGHFGRVGLRLQVAPSHELREVAIERLFGQRKALLAQRGVQVGGTQVQREALTRIHEVNEHGAVRRRVVHVGVGENPQGCVGPVHGAAA